MDNIRLAHKGLVRQHEALSEQASALSLASSSKSLSSDVLLRSFLFPPPPLLAVSGFASKDIVVVILLVCASECVCSDNTWLMHSTCGLVMLVDTEPCSNRIKINSNLEAVSKFLRTMRHTLVNGKKFLPSPQLPAEAGDEAQLDADGFEEQDADGLYDRLSAAPIGYANKGKYSGYSDAPGSRPRVPPPGAQGLFLSPVSLSLLALAPRSCYCSCLLCPCCFLFSCLSLPS